MYPDDTLGDALPPELTSVQVGLNVNKPQIIFMDVLEFSLCVR